MGKAKKKKAEMAKRLKANKSSSFQGKYVNYVIEQLNYASLTRRFVAFLIDFICSSIFISIIPMLITSIVTQKKSFTIDNMLELPLYLQILCCLLAILFAIYYFCLYPASKKHCGQTIGKRAMHIKVQKQNGEDVKLADLLKRELIGSMVLEGETAFPSAFVRYILFLGLPASLSKVLTIASIVISLASILWCIIDSRRRMLHDFVACTRVVDL